MFGRAPATYQVSRHHRLAVTRREGVEHAQDDRGQQGKKDYRQGKFAVDEVRQGVLGLDDFGVLRVIVAVYHHRRVELEGSLGRGHLQRACQHILRVNSQFVGLVFIRYARPGDGYTGSVPQHDFPPANPVGVIAIAVRKAGGVRGQRGGLEMGGQAQRLEATLSRDKRDIIRNGLHFDRGTVNCQFQV